MLPRPLFETLAPNLTGQGFKILLDLVLSSPAPLRVIEVPAVFHERVAGESKLDALVLMQFAGLLLDKVFGGLLPLRFISFALVGALGVLVHLAVLTTALKLVGLQFEAAQTIATVVAMVFNFQLNNEITYRDQRLRGPRLWRGLLLFMLVCGLGAIANVGIAKTLYETAHQLEHRRRDRRGDRRGVELRGLGDAGLARTIIQRREERSDAAIPAGMRPSHWALAALVALTLLRLVVAAAVPARTGRGVLLGVVARPGAWLSRPSADGGALDTHRHRPGRRQHVGRPAAWTGRGRDCLAAAGGRCGSPAAGPPRRSSRRRAAECDAAVRRRRGADDPRHTAAVVLDCVPVGPGAPARQWSRMVVARDRPVRRARDGEQVHRRTAVVRHRRLAAGGTVDACLAAAAGTLARRTAWPGGLLAGCAVERRAWLAELRPTRRPCCRLAARARDTVHGRTVARSARTGHAAGLRLLRRRHDRGRAPELAHARSGVDIAGRTDTAGGGAVHAARARRSGAGQLAGHHLSRRRRRRGRTVRADLDAHDAGRPSLWVSPSRCWSISRRPPRCCRCLPASTRSPAN